MVEVIGRLDQKMQAIEQRFEASEARFRSPEYTDLFEEAMLQAGKALSPDRREYLANMLLHGLTEPELDHARMKKLLFVLNDLTDPEIVVLTYGNLATRSRKEEFYALHEQVLRPVKVAIGAASREDRERHALQKSWRHRLATRPFCLGEPRQRQ